MKATISKEWAYGKNKRTKKWLVTTNEHNFDGEWFNTKKAAVAFVCERSGIDSTKLVWEKQPDTTVYGEYGNTRIHVK